MAVEEARYESLAQSVFDLVPPSSPRIFLYVEFDDGVLSPSLFYELDGLVTMVFTDEPVHEELSKLQEVFGPTVHAMEFEMHGGRFTARFAYRNDSLDFIEYEARCDAALIRVFGHATTSYPSL